jgi:hypothetical protein
MLAAKKNPAKDKAHRTPGRQGAAARRERAVLQSARNRPDISLERPYIVAHSTSSTRAVHHATRPTCHDRRDHILPRRFDQSPPATDVELIPASRERGDARRRPLCGASTEAFLRPLPSRPRSERTAKSRERCKPLCTRSERTHARAQSASGRPGRARGGPPTREARAGGSRDARVTGPHNTVIGNRPAAVRQGTALGVAGLGRCGPRTIPGGPRPHAHTHDERDVKTTPPPTPPPPPPPPPRFRGGARESRGPEVELGSRRSNTAQTS